MMNAPQLMLHVTVIHNNIPYREEPGISWEQSKARLSPASTHDLSTMRVKNETLQVPANINIEAGKFASTTISVYSPNAENSDQAEREVKELEDTDWNLLRELHEILKIRFDEEDLRTLCFYLAVPYSDLPAEGKSGKARELLFYIENRKSILKLIEMGKRLRPDINWPNAS